MVFVPNSILLLIALCGASETKPSWTDVLLEPSMKGSVEALPVNETSNSEQAPFLLKEKSLQYTTITNCGNWKEGCLIIDYSMQFGSLVDVGLSLIAGCLLVCRVLFCRACVCRCRTLTLWSCPLS